VILRIAGVADATSAMRDARRNGEAPSILRANTIRRMYRSDADRPNLPHTAATRIAVRTNCRCASSARADRARRTVPPMRMGAWMRAHAIAYGRDRRTIG